jgi:hypothetical protein
MAHIQSVHASTICGGPDGAGHEIHFPAQIGDGEDDVSMELAQWLVDIDNEQFRIVEGDVETAVETEETDGASVDGDVADMLAAAEASLLAGLDGLAPAAPAAAPRRRGKKAN